MELNDRVEQLEHEMKIMKNEIKAVLLDLRESYLARENPFGPGPLAGAVPSFQAPEEAAVEEIVENGPAGELPDDKPGDYAEPEITVAETAPEEMKRARRREVKPKSRPLELSETGENTSLAMVTALTHWAKESTNQLGQEGARAVVEISELMGNVPPDTQNILLRLISLNPSDRPGKITTQAYLSSLLKLTELLGKCNKTEAALISILLEQKGNG
jgi:hypothetical protein